MELTQQEVMAVLGEKELRIAAQAKHIAALEAKVRELTSLIQVDRAGKKLKSATQDAASAGE